MAQTINTGNFEALVATGKPIVLDFWATWCGPCKRLAPIIEELAKEYDGKIVVGKCDVEENEDLAQEFAIRNIPTVLFFKGGEIVDKVVGAVSKAKLDEKFQALL
jgi:thioredoxin 1